MTATPAAARPLPPGPPRHLLFGNLPAFARDILGFLETCARDHGDVVGLRLAGRPACLLSHPDLIEEVLVAQHRNFVKHSFFWRHVTAIFGDGLLTAHGETWLRQRRLAQPAFHRERVAGYGSAMVEEARREADAWNDGDARDVHDDMMRVTMRIVARTLFGTDVEADVEEVGGAFDVAVQEIAVRFRRPVKIPDWVPLPSNRRFRRAVRTLDEIVYRLIRRRMAEEPGTDLLSLLLEARDEDGTGMTEAQLRDEAVTLFLAGHETTALALSWAFALLSQNPEAREALEGEVDAVLAGRDPEVADLPRLTFTEGVVHEALRLYPPAYVIGRETLAPCVVGGYRIPARATVYVSPWVLHRDPRYFEEPLAFRPGRWADGLARRLPRFAYFPFGGGPRLCIGNSFALMEAALILATVARRWRLTLVEGHSLEPFPSITLRPRHGVRVTVRARTRLAAGAPH